MGPGPEGLEAAQRPTAALRALPRACCSVFPCYLLLDTSSLKGASANAESSFACAFVYRLPLARLISVTPAVGLATVRTVVVRPASSAVKILAVVARLPRLRLVVSDPPSARDSKGAEAKFGQLLRGLML